MKYYLALLALAIAATALAEEPEITDQQRAAMKQAAEFRTFTTTNGTTVIGRPVDYRETADIVELLTPDGSEKVEMATLSKNDQAYIQNWHVACSPLDKRTLRISIDKEVLRDCLYSKYQKEMLPNLNERKRWWNVKTSPLSTDTGKSTQYAFCVANKNRQELTGIKIQYCIYHKAKVEAELLTTRFDDISAGPSGVSGGEIILDREKLPKRTAIDIVRGCFSIDQLAGKEEAVFKTQQVVTPGKVQQRELPQKGQAITSGKDKSREIDCEVLGIRYRVYLPTPNGNYAMMEFAEPKKLLKETEWPEE